MAVKQYGDDYQENCKMKLSPKDLSIMAKKEADRLLSMAGLKNGKKIAAEVKRLLLAEDKRRKNL